MSIELQESPPTDGSGFAVEVNSDRRADIEAKQLRVAALLRELGRDGLLLLDPENVAWITSGATMRGHLDPATHPAVFCTAEGRWLICSNVDSQRMFEEELDGLGFQLKEWPWHWGREQYLADLCSNRRMACDRPPLVEGDLLHVNARLQQMRRTLSPYEQACLTALGQLVAHALEAACRTLKPQDTEREVAGQLAHRLLHRGVMPVHVGVAADGRSRSYRRFSFTATPIDQYAVLMVTGRKYGLHATASRMVAFGEVPAEIREEFNAVVRVSASYLASTWPDAVPREILQAGRRIYQLSGHEHEWLLAPQGFVTGRAAVEINFTPQTVDLTHPGWAVTWNATAGAAVSSDTYLVTERGPLTVTPAESWPLKRVRIQGAECIRPDILVR
ncbi:MAG: M24 family metallopeptidase [Gemmataceae bacterium]